MMRLFFSLILLACATLSAPVYAAFGNSNPLSLGNNNSRFVPVDEAFAFSYFQQGEQLYLDWQVKPGYYLYQDRISVQGKNVRAGDVTLPQGEAYHDEFFGDVTIYTTPLSLMVPLSDYQDGARLTVQYQGCAKAGFCYPPETRVIDVSAFRSLSTGQSTPPTERQAGAADPAALPSSQPPLSQQDSLASQLAGAWWTPLLFLLLGIGLAFTPCVLPMYPILTSIVLGGKPLSQRRTLLLSLVYVQGMALTYTLLGLVVAQAGLQFQAALQHPYVLIGLSILFIALALSMFGLYTIQLPNRAQTWLTNLSNQQQGGSLAGVFAMGAISGLVCSPCTTAPLSGALLYVAQSGDLLTGGAALYALALGMGIPLILVALFGQRLLPRSGAWMNRVKTLFGFILLAAPIFLLERLLPDIWSTVLWSALGLFAFGWLYHIKNSLPFAGWQQSLLGIVAILGLLASAQPALNYWFMPGSAQVQNAPQIEFTRIADVSDLNQQLAKARAEGKAVMLDFYADWCVACKEFDKYTFHQTDVEHKLQNFVLLQADVTRNQPQDIELLRHLQVLGLPTIAFWNTDGDALDSARITGFLPAEDFLSHLQQHQL